MRIGVDIWADRFEIRREIGSGGMGVVYEAWDRRREEVVALKTLQMVDPQSLYALKREFRSLAGLRHPGLVRLGELFVDGQTWFFTMEYVPGQNFLEFVRPPLAASPAEADSALFTAPLPTGPTTDDDGEPSSRRAGPAQFDEARLRWSLAELVHAVAALHEAGRVHRDLKPSNVVITADGRVVVLDFGLVQIGEADPLAPLTDGQMAGTYAYMAPEQAAGEAVYASDWYSLGTMLYQALTGRYPFSGAPMRVIVRKQLEDPPAPTRYADDLPPDLVELCLDLLARDPSARPDAEAILGRLGADTSVTSTSGGRRAVAAEPGGPRDFVGRAGELARLDHALAEARAGRCATVLISGPPGVGKTTLVRQFLRERLPPGSGAVVLSGRCYEREFVPYKAFDGVVDTLSHHLNQMDQVDAALVLPEDTAPLVRLFPVLKRVGAVRRALDTRRRRDEPFDQPAQQVRARGFRALRDLLGRLGRSRPLVVIIDDLHWADVDSLQLMRELLAPALAPPMLLIGTQREPGAATAGRSPFGDDAVRLELDTLGEADAAALFTGAWRHLHDGQDPPPAIAEAALAQAAGHPLFVRELAAYLAKDAAPTQFPRLEEVLWARVAGLDPVDRACVELLAVAGTPVAEELVTEAIDAPRAAVVLSVETLELARLARTSAGQTHRRVDLFHDRVRDAVLDHLAEPRRLALHVQLADALMRRDDLHHDVSLRVRHLAAAGRRQEAADEALRGAEQAREAMAFDRCAELLAEAISLGQFADDRARQLHRRRADALANAGRGTAAGDAYLRAIGDQTGAAGRELLYEAADAYLTHGDFERGFPLVRELAEAAGLVLHDSRMRVFLSTVYHRARLALRRRRMPPEADRQVPPERGERLRALQLVSRHMIFLDPVHAFNLRAQALIEALDVGDRQAVFEGTILEATANGFRGGRRGYAQAKRLLAQARALADSELDFWFARGADAVVATVRGDFVRAIDVFEALERWAETTPVVSHREFNSMLVWMTKSLRELGRLYQLRHSVERYLRDAERRGDRFVVTLLVRQGSLAWLAADQPDTARQILAEADWPAPLHGIAVQQWFEMRAWGELALYEGAVPSRYDEFRKWRQRLSRSMFGRRFQIARLHIDWWWGRLMLAWAQTTRDPQVHPRLRRIAARMEGEAIGYGRVWAAMLRADRLALSPQPAPQIATGYDHAAELAEAEAMAVHAAIARLRAAQWRSGTRDSTAADRARAELSALGVADPDRFALVYSPVSPFPPPQLP